MGTVRGPVLGSPGSSKEISARSGGSEWLPGESELAFGNHECLAVEVGERQTPLVHPSFERWVGGGRVGVRSAGHERGDQVGPQRWRVGGIGANGERNEAGDRLDCRGSRARLPFIPLLDQPPSSPLVHTHVGIGDRPSERFTGDDVEDVALSLGDEQE